MPTNQLKIFKKFVWKKFRTTEKVEWWWRKFHAARRRRVWKLSEQQNHRCCYCGRLTWVYDDCINKDNKFRPDRLPGMTEWEMATADHLVPSSQGGTERIDNMVMGCMRCNGVRGDQDAIEFWEIVSNTQKMTALYRNRRKVKRLERNERHQEEKQEKRRDKRDQRTVWLAYLCLISPLHSRWLEEVQAEAEVKINDPKWVGNRLKAIYGDLVQAA